MSQEIITENTVLCATFFVSNIMDKKKYMQLKERANESVFTAQIYSGYVSCCFKIRHLSLKYFAAWRFFFLYLEIKPSFSFIKENT